MEKATLGFRNFAFIKCSKFWSVSQGNQLGQCYTIVNNYHFKKYFFILFCFFKVADFGLARYVIDDQYTSNGGAKFPIKWSPPEVLNYTRFSSKSDVWAFGVLCWEVFTCGDMPYGRSKNPEVVERVQRGQVLSRPQGCPGQVYEVSRNSFSFFFGIYRSFKNINLLIF